MKGKLVFAISTVFALTAFTGNEPVDEKKLGISLDAMDRSVSPRNDFYMYANGTWVRNNPVPDDEPRWGSFDELRRMNQEKIKVMFEDAAKENAAPGSARQKMRDFYLSAMDTVSIEKQRLQPVQHLFDMIHEIKTKEDILTATARLYSNGIGSTLTFFVHRDLKKSDQNRCYIRQGGINLPDKDYYLKDDDRSKKIREEYIKHVTAMFTLKGDKYADRKAAAVMKIETALAESMKSRVELRDQEKNYNKWSMADLVKATPSLNWNNFFKTAGAANVKEVIVGQPEFLAKLNKLATEVSIEEWKTYLAWNALTSTASLLSSDFAAEDFKFYSTVLNGVSERKPRWKEVVEVATGSLDEIVGQVYVEKYFSAESKKRVQTMVNNMLAVYRSRIEKLDWMSDATKQKALDKLSRFNTKLGYPDKWKDYSALNINRDSYATNYLRCGNHAFKEMISKLNKPVDKTEWNIQAHTVNAYYDPTLNEIVFPAAIMQPPFFYPEADDAVNYGAIGAVIGHEITHGFDDQGSKYDGTGNLNNWWTDEDRRKFNERTKILVDQFNKYEALPGLTVNGELTLGENIADLGGLSVAYDSFILSMKDKPSQPVAGLTPEQRFFLAFAQVWKGNAKEEYTRKLIMTDVHSPGKFRAVGAPSNMESFYNAFGVTKGDAMYRDDEIRAKIW